jgi:hypothetical protein
MSRSSSTFLVQCSSSSDYSFMGMYLLRNASLSLSHQISQFHYTTQNCVYSKVSELLHCLVSEDMLFSYQNLPILLTTLLRILHFSIIFPI